MPFFVFGAFFADFYRRLKTLCWLLLLASVKIIQVLCLESLQYWVLTLHREEASSTTIVE